MDMLWMVVVAVLLAATAAYAQLQIPRFTAGARRTAIARGVLSAVGVASGVVGAALVAEPRFTVLAFVIGFGVVHLPAAFILMLKRSGGAGKS